MFEEAPCSPGMRFDQELHLAVFGYRCDRKRVILQGGDALT